ncbi:MAG: TetR/AcrR family transcriptional regulator, partial [Limosilactobacillus reuteri]|nr:TetR/AcrR family transcriptional regulator [Limosilactobacillus mucosae]MDY2688747.1 TetR/AcrR family transcriptional regulator [Limosilactobacillus reuteri]MDY3299064.1 TetR/AcrR family transcriptional regulator [Limosilactobacillus reuteri]
SGHYRKFEDLQSVVETMARQLLIVEHGFLPDES